MLQAIVAVAVLLFDAGVITPPAPQAPVRAAQQYGQYGARRRTTDRLSTAAPHAAGRRLPQRPGYPSQYGGGYPGGGPSTGGFSARSTQSGPPTPPTGFPTFGQPPPSAPTDPGADAVAIGVVFHAVGPPAVVV